MPSATVPLPFRLFALPLREVVASVSLLCVALAAQADPASQAYTQALERGDRTAANRAQSFLAPPYGDDPNSWHGIVIRKAANGRIGKPAHPFTYQDMTHPKVRALYDRAGVAAMEKSSRSELELIQRITNWVNGRWGHMRPLPYASWDGLEILDRAEQGDAFWCEYKAALFVQTCNSAGLTARIVGINRRDEDSHMVAEVYSNQFRKWMLVDAWWNCYYERNGTPLSAIEFHRAAADLTGINVVFGENGKKNEVWDLRTGKASSLPHANQREAVATDGIKGMNDWYYDVHIVLRNDHTVNPQDRSNVYVDGFLVPPNFRGGAWRGAQLHWVDDKTPPQLTAPNSDDITDFEWPLNEVRVDLQKISVPGEPAVIEARFSTQTPCFSRYVLEVNGAPVALEGDLYTWKLKPGTNALKIASVNAVGRAGHPSEFVLAYDPASIAPRPSVSVLLKNPGFETVASATRATAAPENWTTVTSNPLHAGEFAVDPTEKHTGGSSLRATPARDLKTGLEYAFIVRSENFRANPASDVIYSIWLKAANDGTRVDLALLDGTYKGHGTYTEQISVDREWKRYELKCRLHNQLSTLWVGFKVYHGTVWADDAEIAEVRQEGASTLKP